MTTKSLALESMREELVTAQKLLKIQVEENYKAHAHIMLLDAEIDSLKELAENKQLKINKLKEQLLEKDGQIRQLNSRFEDAIIEKKAFDELDGVSKRILLQCRDKDKEIEQLQLELKIERDMKEDKLLYEHNRIKEVAATEIILTSKLSDLQHRFEKSQASLSEKSSQVEKLSDLVRRMKEQLEWNKEMRLDQVGRSRESEYRTMSKLEDITMNYYKVLNDKETLQQTVQVQSVRGDMLQEQLNSSTEDFDKTTQIFSSLVDAAEHSVSHSRKNERALTAANRSLQVELNMSKLALDKVVKSHRKAHQITPFDRSVEPLLSQTMPEPLRGVATAKNNASTTLTNLTWTVKTPSTTKKASEGVQRSSKRLTPLVTAGDRLLAATYPRDQVTATVSQQEDDILTDVGALKHRMMTKYFTLLSTAIQSDPERMSSSPSSRTSGKTPTLSAVDLCQSELRDDDFKKVIEWLRILPLADIDSVDVKNNYLTGGALTSLFVWLLSLSAEETVRPSPLLLDLKHNLVTDSEIRHCVDFITTCLEESEFSFITSECDGRLIFFYAKRPQQQQQQEGEEADGDDKGQDAAGEAQMLFCKVDLRFQRQRSELLNTTSRMVASSVQLQLDPTLTMPPSAISEDKVLPGSELLVFPRESVFNGMVME